MPTVSETLPGFHRVPGSYGVLALAKMPRAIVKQVGNEIVRLVNTPDIREQLQNIALAPAPIAGADYHKVLLDQIEALSSMVSGIGLRAK